MPTKGFTLIEMLVSIAIFSVIIIAFIGILVVVSEIQVQLSSSVAVDQESQSLLQKVQYYVETASVINIATSTPVSTLQFFVASSSLDPSSLTLSSGTVYLQQTTTGTLQALTSPKVVVSNLSFTRNASPPGHDTVSVSFTMAYNTPATDIAQAFSQFFQSTVEHVSAATFDTNVLPSASGEALGNSGLLWTPINSVINFSGSNVGIGAGVTNPAEQLSVGGGLQLVSQGSAPSCSSAIRGTLWFYSPGGANQDHLSLCAANASGTVVWQTLY
ncbi:MAG: prepilin-type N-terminal cleavage/methylation domain-containing protein [Minisyncoccia bacterium]|jgi:prepilin-type N-terminal cleavage/methylation domain-containing protein